MLTGVSLGLFVASPWARNVRESSPESTADLRRPAPESLAVAPLPSPEPSGLETADLRIVLLGDSLTAGSFYEETGTPPNVKFRFTRRPWAGAMRRELQRLSPGLNVTVDTQGFPGKNTAQITGHAFGRGGKAAAAVSSANVVIAMAGTNDIIGSNAAMDEALTVEAAGTAAAAILRRIGALHARLAKRGICSIALPPPPLHFDVDAAGYSGSTKVRPYCHKRKLDRSLRLLRNSLVQQMAIEAKGVVTTPSRVPCVMELDWGTVNPVTSEGLKRLWSDCLHPNAAGYRNVGVAAARYLTATLATNCSSPCRRVLEQFERKRRV